MKNILVTPQAARQVAQISAVYDDLINKLSIRKDEDAEKLKEIKRVLIAQIYENAQLEERLKKLTNDKTRTSK